MCRFPGVQKPLDQYGPQASGGGKEEEEEEDEDDDFDLFGDDDEVSSEMQFFSSVLCDACQFGFLSEPHLLLHSNFPLLLACPFSLLSLLLLGHYSMSIVPGVAERSTALEPLYLCRHEHAQT